MNLDLQLVIVPHYSITQEPDATHRGLPLQYFFGLQVSELAPLRSLLECVRDAALRPVFGVQRLCDLAQQICRAMSYLEDRSLVHGDLGARNVLVFSKDKVRASSLISDQ